MNEGAGAEGAGDGERVPDDTRRRLAAAYPVHTMPGRGHRAGRGATEYEFARLTLPRHLSRNVVTRLLVDQAEYGGWELDRLRILHDGTRTVVLRRRIIRQPRPVQSPA